jgi:hypothetical protein
VARVIAITNFGLVSLSSPDTEGLVVIAVSAAYAVGELFGMLVLPVIAIIALVKAFTRRTTGWIIAGTIGGLILLIPMLMFVGGFISGFTPGHQRVVNVKKVNNAPSANADNPSNLALPDDRCDKALLEASGKLNATLPRQLDQYTRMDTVLAGHRRMMFFYTILGLHSGDYTKAQIDEHLDAHQERVKRSYKTMPQLDVYRQNHVEMVYTYKDEDGNYLGQRSIKLD